MSDPGTRLELGDHMGSRFTEWRSEQVATAIHDRIAIPLLDSDDFANPERVLSWGPYDIEIVRASRAESAELWRKIREEGPQPGSPAWIAQKPAGTRWLYEIFGPR